VQLLLDTQAFIWSAAAPELLAPSTRTAIKNPSNDVYVSAVSAWEIVIKHALGKIRLPDEPEVWVPSRIVAMGFRSLSVTVEHALGVRSLPHHHEDPFDRMLVAQASVEELRIVSHDRVFERYGLSTEGLPPIIV